MWPWSLRQGLCNPSSRVTYFIKHPIIILRLLISMHLPPSTMYPSCLFKKTSKTYLGCVGFRFYSLPPQTFTHSKWYKTLSMNQMNRTTVFRMNLAIVLGQFGSAMSTATRVIFGFSGKRRVAFQWWLGSDEIASLVVASTCP